MNHNFVVNIDSISVFAKDLKNESEKLKEILEYLIQITNDMEQFFDTPSAHVLKEELLRYLKNAKTPCDKLENLSNKVALFNKNYKNIYDVTQNSVGGGE